MIDTDTLVQLAFLGLILLGIYAAYRTIKKVRAARYLTVLFQSGELRSLALYQPRAKSRELHFELSDGKTYQVKEIDGYLGMGSVPVPTTRLADMKFKHVVWGAKSLVYGDDDTFKHGFDGIHDHDRPVWKLTYGSAWPDALNVSTCHG